MLRLTSPHAIRAMLRTDALWAAYALGDLAPGFFEYTEWWCDAAQTALVMVFRKFPLAVLFTFGPPAALAPLLTAVQEPRLHLLIQPEALPLVENAYTVAQPIPMWRMALTPADFRPVPTTAVRLGPADLPALEALYADGQATGEAPDFFFPAMLDEGVFYGIWAGSTLLAAAGTHLVIPSEGVAAVGNVYTRRDQRGQGLAAQTTSAVTQALLQYDPPLPYLILNVTQHNQPAQRVYTRLGFRRVCPFIEGFADRKILV